MIINWPASDVIEVIDAIRDAIGRDILIEMTVSGIACTASGCGLDPVRNVSINPFCPVCAGEYWLDTLSGYLVNGYVRMLGNEVQNWQVGGKIIEGDAEIQIKYTVTNMDAVNRASHYIVDGKTYLQNKVILRGVPAVNRIIVTLKEQE